MNNRYPSYLRRSNIMNVSRCYLSRGLPCFGLSWRGSFLTDSAAYLMVGVEELRDSKPRTFLAAQVNLVL